MFGPLNWLRGLRPRWLGPLSGLCLLSAFWPLAGLPAAFALGLVLLTAPPVAPRAGRWLLVASGALSLVGLGRFVVEEAAAGVIRGGRQAAERTAVEHLRGFVAAQDALRRSALLDPDGDGIGSAASLSQLCGDERPPGVSEQRWRPPLHCHERVTLSVGPAELWGAYWFFLCLPTTAGWSAGGSAEVDAERAERSYVAYAWPAGRGDFRTVFAVDQDEAIEQLSLPPGRTVPPHCEALWAPPAGQSWSRWKGKRPRRVRPGDPAWQPEAAEPSEL